MSLSSRFLLSRFLLFCAAILSTRIPAAAQENNLEALEEQAFKQAAALVSPSVVQIQTTGGRDQVGQILTGTGPTTGVVVSKDGYIISSAFNFIAKPSTILVNLPDGRKNLLARLVATDHSKMLVLLKIDVNNLQPAPAAPKKSLKVGHWAIALGRTYSDEVPNMSVGIISALDRIGGKAIQTDAKVSPVNYGGPLISIEGKVQGILVPLSSRGRGETAGVEWYDSGIGFAIPMEDVYRVVERLKKGEDLYPGLMGISFKSAGVLGGEPVIDRVRSNSPAEKAGLKPGDRILEVNGQAVRRQNDVQTALGPLYAGDTVTIKVKRGDEVLTRRLTLVQKLEPFVPAYLGILPSRPLQGESRPSGVRVRHVFTGSPAEKAGLRKLDLIVKVNDQNIADASALADIISRLRPESKATLTILRDKQQKTVSVTLATIPDEVVKELHPEVQLPGENVTVQTGRLTVKMPKHEREYWAYVPASYNPKASYGLMVWLHPHGDTMEAAIFKQWQRICDERGILILAPKAGKLAGWTPEETEYVKEAIDDFMDTYSVDRNRIFVHSFGSGVPFALQVTFKHRDLIRGAAIAGGTLRTAPPGNSPQYRQQFHFVCGEKDPVYRFTQRSVVLLRQQKFPVSFTTVKELGEEYPSLEYIREIARWADSLDRI